MGRGFLSDGFFYLLSGSESLQSLSITDATLGSGGAQEIQLKHESLRYLQVVKCRVLRIAIRFTFFLHLDLTLPDLLSVLHLGAVMNFSDGCFEIGCVILCCIVTKKPVSFQVSIIGDVIFETDRDGVCNASLPSLA